MNMKYLVVAVIVIVVAVTGAILALRIIKPSGPSFSELFALASNSTYTANYNYYIYSDMAGQVSTEDYLLTYSQSGLTDRYIIVTTTTAPQTSLYIVTTRLGNGTLIQCVAESLYSGCTPINQTFNLIYLMLPTVNSSSFTFIGTQKMLGYNAYCYVSRNTTLLGNLVPSAAQYGLGSLPVNVTSEVCVSNDGVPLLIRLSAYTTLSISGYLAQFNITQLLRATKVQDGVYLSSNATALLKALGINGTG